VAWHYPVRPFCVLGTQSGWSRSTARSRSSRRHPRALRPDRPPRRHGHDRWL